jgi:hypothetical protein
MGRTFLRYLVLPAFIAALVAGLGGFAPRTAEAKSALYERFDVDLVLLDDGAFDITETQVVAFDGGPFSKGHRSIPTARTGGMTGISVSEVIDGDTIDYEQVPNSELGSGDNQFSVTESTGTVQIYWTFESTYSDTRTFVLRYIVPEALRVYPDATPPNQQIWRTMVGSELTEETPVDSSHVTISLPESVDLTAVVLESNGNADMPQQHSTDGQVFTWDHDAFSSGEELTIRMQFPIILENVPPPAWQAEDDAQRAREQSSNEQRAVIHLMLLAVGLLLVAGGGTGAYGLWYARGRDPHVGVVADFLPEPPDDLSPGTAGALIDERANESDVVATLLDLARRGDVTMTDIGLLGPNKRATGHDYLFELAKVEESAAPHELGMLKAVFGPRLEIGSKARLSQIAATVIASYPAFKEDLYQDLVRHGYFTHSPEATRKRWSRAGLIMAGAGILVGLIGWIAYDAWMLIPGVALTGLGLIFWRMGRAMPRKTEAGAEAAAKWKAFRRYLDDIEKYENLNESREIFDRYLPFTVAFGLDQTWVQKFARAEGATPGWFDWTDVAIPRGHGGWHTGGGAWTYGGDSSGSGGSGGGVDMPDFDMPDLQGSSDSAGRALQSGSSGLMDVLKVAGAIIEIAAAFSGGGSDGGSSGGGGGGFD